MKGFFIDVSNGLLDPKHVAAMGPAVWEFMWCLDKITKIDDHGVGWVLGGKPVNLKEIVKSIGIHETNVSKHLNRLEEKGYIFRVRTPYGIIITVAKAQRRFSKIAKSRISKIAKSPSEIAKSNKTISEDNTISWTKELLKKLEERRDTKIVTVGPQLQALGQLKKAGLEPDAIWTKLLELENLSDFWKDHPPDYANLAKNFHRLQKTKSRYKKILPKRPT